MTWHVTYRGETRQLSEEALREGLISKSIPGDVLVRSEGMSGWQSASAVFGVAAEPPLLPSRGSSNARPPSLLLLFLIIVTLIAVSACAQVEQGILIDFLAARVEFAAAIALHLVLLIVILVFGLITTLMVWRHPSRRDAVGLAGALFFLSACTSILQAVNVGSFALVASDLYRLNLAVSTWGDAEIRDTANHTARVTGPIGPHLMRDFMALERASGPISTIEITSEGGLVDQALELARHVELRQVSVVVRHQCLSACILIAVASPESYADEDAVFGFHRTSPAAEIRTEISEYALDQLTKDSLDFLRRHGVPESVLEDAAKHGPESVHMVSAREMVEFGAIKGLLLGGRVIKVGQKRRYGESR